MTCSAAILAALGVCLAQSPDPFDARLAFSADVHELRPWTEMVARHPSADAWADVVAGARRLRGRARLDYVEREVDRAPYVPSVVNWKRFRVETPAELRVYGGACEDFAVAKMYVLAAVGVPAASMRIAVVDSPAGPHTVLAVRESSETLALDEARRAAVPFAATGYRLLYAVSPAGWWRPQ